MNEYVTRQELYQWLQDFAKAIAPPPSVPTPAIPEGDTDQEAAEPCGSGEKRDAWPIFREFSNRSSVESTAKRLRYMREAHESGEPTERILSNGLLSRGWGGSLAAQGITEQQVTPFVARRLSEWRNLARLGSALYEPGGWFESTIMLALSLMATRRNLGKLAASEEALRMVRSQTGPSVGNAPADGVLVREFVKLMGLFDVNEGDIVSAVRYWVDPSAEEGTHD